MYMADLCGVGDGCGGSLNVTWAATVVYLCCAMLCGSEGPTRLHHAESPTSASAESFLRGDTLCRRGKKAAKKMLSHLRTWQGTHVVCIVNALYSLVTCCLYLFFEDGGHYSYSRSGKTLLM